LDLWLVTHILFFSPIGKEVNRLEPYLRCNICATGGSCHEISLKQSPATVGDPRTPQWTCSRNFP